MAEQKLEDYRLVFFDTRQGCDRSFEVCENKSAWECSHKNIEYIEQDDRFYGVGFFSARGWQWLVWYEDEKQQDPLIPYPKELQETLIALCKARYPWLN